MTSEEMKISSDAADSHRRLIGTAPQMFRALKAVFREPSFGSLGTATQRSVIAALRAVEGLSE